MPRITDEDGNVYDDEWREGGRGPSVQIARRYGPPNREVQRYDMSTPRSTRSIDAGSVYSGVKGVIRREMESRRNDPKYASRKRASEQGLKGAVNKWAYGLVKGTWLDPYNGEANEYGNLEPDGEFTPKRLKPGPQKRAIMPGKPGGPNINNYDYSTVPVRTGIGRTVRIGKSRKMGFRKRRYGRRRFGKKRRGGNKTVTFQHDAVSTYRKSRMSRRGRRRMRRSFKRSIATTLKTVEVQTIRRIYNVTAGAEAGSQGTIVLPGLYSLNGSTQWDDMSQIAQKYQSVNVLADVDGYDGTPDVTQMSKIMFNSANMQMDFCNTGATPMIVEVYLCKSRDQGIPRVSPGGDYVISDYRPDGVTTLAGGETTRQYNSLFDSKTFCQRNEILSCQKVYLQAGASSDKSLTLSRNKYFSGSSLINTDGNQFNWENNTVFWVLIITGAPKVLTTSSAEFSAASLSVTTERTYRFKVMPGGQSTSGQL